MESGRFGEASASYSRASTNSGTFNDWLWNKGRSKSVRSNGLFHSLVQLKIERAAENSAAETPTKQGYIVSNDLECEVIKLVEQVMEEHEIEISDHAIVRYLERVEGVNIESIRKKFRKALRNYKRRRQVGDQIDIDLDDDHSLVLRDDIVITVLPRRHHGSPHPFKRMIRL